MKTSHKYVALAAAALAGFFGTQAHAAILPTVVLTSNNDIVQAGIDPDVNLNHEAVTYSISGSLGTLTVSIPSGGAGNLTNANGSLSSITGATLTATVYFAKNGSGVFQAETTDGGSNHSNITITGTVASTGHTFFTSTTLQAFAFTETAGTGQQTFEMLFGPGGSGDYSTGNKFGFIVHSAVLDATASHNPVTPDNNFDLAFSNTYVASTQIAATSDTLVPEPASLALIGLAAPLLMKRRRRAV